MIDAEMLKTSWRVFSRDFCVVLKAQQSPFQLQSVWKPESTVGKRGQMHGLKIRSTKAGALMCSLPALRDELFCMSRLFFLKTYISGYI